jgi:hypothetical protein
VYGTQIGMTYGNGTEWTRQRVSANIGTGVWNHVGFVYSGSTVDFYLNGEKIGTSTLSSTPVLVEDRVIIGSWGFNSGTYGVNTIYSNYHFNGCINDVRVYDHALSPKEVEEISKGLILHY